MGMSNTIVDKIKDVFNFGVEDVEDEEVLDSADSAIANLKK